MLENTCGTSQQATNFNSDDVDDDDDEDDEDVVFKIMGLPPESGDLASSFPEFQSW